MRYFSLFSGIGGFELGIQRAYVGITDGDKNGTGKEDSKGNDEGRQGLESKERKRAHDALRRPVELPNRSDDPRAPRCVGYSEIDRFAIEIYEKHFKHKNYGDIREIDGAKLPRFDLLVGGFPCQSFSIAGKRKGFEDTRGTLFFEISRLLWSRRPRIFLLENVKGLTSHDDGRTFGIIIASLDELGYDLQWQVLNSKHFGVPQNRERVYIVGHLRGTPRPEVFPLQSDDLGYCGEPLPEPETFGYVRNMSDIKSGRRHSVRIRRLTPVECERLQGFPDGWTEGVSDTQRYKTLGNAVTVNVIEHIVRKILLSE